MQNYKVGMTLLEVIASMFIICIGLLSVLMVIPYGAFQVTQARNAEYISNMLAAGAEDLKITGWDKEITNQAGVGIAPFLPSTSGDPSTNGKPITIGVHIIDPFVINFPPSNIDYIDIQAVKNDPIRKEMMTGSDDLKYKLHENARTEITPADPSKPQSPTSSGQYTYFITIKPQEIFSNEFVDNGNTMKEFTSVKFTTDLLGCYQRVEPCFKLELDDKPDSQTFYFRAAKFTVKGNDRLDFSTTKYVFVTWKFTTPDPPANYPEPDTRIILRRGEWCKVVSVGNNKDDNQVITVIANDVVSIKNNAEELNQNMEALEIFVFPGVMYHKRIYD
jgi:type II secretory pathway pseudopilin PulG